MKHNLFLLIAVAFLAACSTPDIPAPIKNAKADFTYRVFDEYHPLTIVFQNASTDGLSVWLWQMGDGKSYSSGDYLIHEYAKAGTYDVTLVCKDKNSYTYDVTKTITITGTGTISGTGGDSENPGTQEELNPAFSYDRETPLMLSFFPLNSKYDSYKWDFGDGTWSYAKEAIHTYEALGTYTVTLTVNHNGNTASTKSKITLTQPTAYVDGYTIYAIPYDNKYYRLVFKDDALLPSSWDWNTIYTPILTTSDLPYSYTMNTKKEFANPTQHDYWMITLMRANSSSGNGETSCLKCKLLQSDLLQYRPEYIWRSESGNTAFGIKMGYSY